MAIKKQSCPPRSRDMAANKGFNLYREWHTAGRLLPLGPSVTVLWNWTVAPLDSNPLIGQKPSTISSLPQGLPWFNPHLSLLLRPIALPPTHGRQANCSAGSPAASLGKPNPSKGVVHLPGCSAQGLVPSKCSMNAGYHHSVDCSTPKVCARARVYIHHTPLEVHSWKLKPAGFPTEWLCLSITAPQGQCVWRWQVSEMEWLRWHRMAPRPSPLACWIGGTSGGRRPHSFALLPWQWSCGISQMVWKGSSLTCGSSWVFQSVSVSGDK